MSSESRGAQASTNNTDYYAILGVERTATQEEIHRAYRRLALQLHPDKNSDPNATAQFQAVEKAHRTLKDPKLRSVYDALGAQATELVDQYGGYPTTHAEMSGCKKFLYMVVCLLTGCGFCCGCCCLCCGCCCCFNYCCNHCCGLCKTDKDSATVESEQSNNPFQHSTGRVHRQPTNDANDSAKY